MVHVHCAACRSPSRWAKAAFTARRTCARQRRGCKACARQGVIASLGGGQVAQRRAVLPEPLQVLNERRAPGILAERIRIKKSNQDLRGPLEDPAKVEQPTYCSSCHRIEHPCRRNDVRVRGRGVFTPLVHPLDAAEQRQAEATER